MAGQQAVSNDIFNEEINHILLLFRDNIPYSSSIVDSNGAINSVLDFFIFYQKDSVFDEAHVFFQTHFLYQDDVFFYYQKWYVTIKMLLLFVNTNKEQNQYLIGSKSSRYQHFDAWITDTNNPFNKSIVELIETLQRSDLQNESYIDNIERMTGFDDVDRKSIVDDIAKLIVRHLVLNFELYFDFTDIPNLNIKDFSKELKLFLRENDQIDSTEADFFEHIIGSSKDIYLNIKTDLSFIQYKIIWDKLDILWKFLNKRRLDLQNLKDKHEKELKQKNDEMQKTIDDLNKNKENNEKKITELESKIVQLEKEIKDLKDKTTQDDEQLDKLNKQIFYLEKLLENLQRTVKVTKDMNKKNHFDKITDDSHDVDEDRKDPDGSEQEEDPDGSEEQKDTDGSEEQEEDQKFQDMLFEAMNKIKKTTNMDEINPNEIKQYRFYTLYSSVLKSNPIYVINGKGYHLLQKKLEKFTIIEGGFLRDIELLRVYYVYQSNHEIVNNCIYFLDYRISTYAFCCPDNKFRYFNDKDEFVTIPDKSDMKLYMNIVTKEIYTMGKDSTQLINPNNRSIVAENNILIIDEQNKLYYTNHSRVIKVNIKDVNAEEFVTDSNKKIKIIKHKKTKNRTSYMLFILEGFVFTHQNITAQDIELKHHFGPETFQIYKDLNKLFFVQCYAEGNLYVIVMYITLVNARHTNKTIMLHINEKVWCQYDNKEFEVQEDNVGLFLYLGINNKYTLPEKMYIYDKLSVQGNLSSSKKTYRTSELSIKELINMTPQKISPQRRSSYNSAEPDAITDSRIQHPTPMKGLTRQIKFSSTKNLPQVDENKSPLNTARSSRPQTPLTADDGSPGFFYDENQEYDSPSLSSHNKQSPGSDNFHSPGSAGYNTAETETPSPQRNVMIAESV